MSELKLRPPRDESGREHAETRCTEDAGGGGWRFRVFFALAGDFLRAAGGAASWQYGSGARRAIKGEFFPGLQRHHAARLLHFGNRVLAGVEAADYSRGAARLPAIGPGDWGGLRSAHANCKL